MFGMVPTDTKLIWRTAHLGALRVEVHSDSRQYLLCEPAEGDRRVDRRHPRSWNRNPRGHGRRSGCTPLGPRGFRQPVHGSSGDAHSRYRGGEHRSTTGTLQGGGRGDCGRRTNLRNAKSNCRRGGWSAANPTCNAYGATSHRRRSSGCRDVSESCLGAAETGADSLAHKDCSSEMAADHCSANRAGRSGSNRCDP